MALTRLIVCLCGGLTLLLAGCGNSDDSSSGHASGTQTPAGEIGERVRTLIAVTSYASMDGFERRGVAVGARQGACAVPDPDDHRAALGQARRTADSEAGASDPADEEMLIAQCGDDTFAFVMWVAGTKQSAAGFQRVRGSWKEMQGDPVCDGPKEIASLWDIDRDYCDGIELEL